MFNHLHGNWRLPWGRLSFTQGDLGMWEDRSHLESGALQAKVPLGDQMPAVRK